MKPIDGHQPSWLSGRHLSRLRTLCASVQRRTGYGAWVDERTAEVCFGRIDPATGQMRIPFWCDLFKDPMMTVPHTFDAATEDWHEDSICWALNRTKVSAATAAHIRADGEKSRERSDRAAIERKAVESTERSFETMERAYERHSMGRHFKRSHLVNGLKE